MLGLIGGLLGSGMSLIGSAIGNNSAMKAVKEQNRGNRELADLAYKREREMWDLQNEYNSPSMQMERFKQAGLNPNLMYGQGDAGNASGRPSYDAPQMAAYTGFGDFGATQAGQNLMQGLSLMNQMTKTDAEIENIRQNTQNLQAQEENTRLRTIMQGYVNAKTETEAKFFERAYMAEINRNESSIRNIEENTIFTAKQRERFEQLTPFVLDKTKADLNQKLFDLNVMSPAKLKNLQTNTNYQRALTILSERNTQIMYYQLEQAKAAHPYRNVNQAYKAMTTKAEALLKKALQEEGWNYSASVWNNIANIIYNQLSDITPGLNEGFTSSSYYAPGF